MRTRIACAAAVALFAAAGQAAPPAWPADLKGAIQGTWVAENNARSIEIVGDEVYIRSDSQFAESYFGPVGSKMATVGTEDATRASPTHRFFTGTCINRATNFAPSRCTSYVNQVEGRKGMTLQLNDQRYWREADLSDWSKTHRLRKDP